MVHGDWSHGICGCFENCSVCIFSFLVPCYQFGQNAEAVGDSCCCCCIIFLIPFLGLCCKAMNRGKIRTAQGIDGSCCGDFLYSFCCPFCSLAQEGNEALVMRGNRMAAQMARQ